MSTVMTDLVTRQRIAAGVAAEARHQIDDLDTAFAALAPATQNDRRCNLLAVIREQGGVWRTGDVVRLYQQRGWGCCRSTARGDLRLLARHGFLAEHGADNDRRYRAVGGMR
jgi:hypothetical protein